MITKAFYIIIKQVGVEIAAGKLELTVPNKGESFVKKTILGIEMDFNTRHPEYRMHINEAKE